MSEVNWTRPQHRNPTNQFFEWADSKVYAPPCKYKKTVDQLLGVVRLALGSCRLWRTTSLGYSRADVCNRCKDCKLGNDEAW